jgi:hypothetical protein
MGSKGLGTKTRTGWEAFYSLQSTVDRPVVHTQDVEHYRLSRVDGGCPEEADITVQEPLLNTACRYNIVMIVLRIS